jgi:hypothetical protein
MATQRARFEFHDETLDRSVQGRADAVLIVADGKVHIAATHEQAFDMLVDAADHMRTHMRGGSARAAAVARFVADGRAAISGERAARPRQAIVTPSAVLDVVREQLGADAYERVRRAAAVKMGVPG